MAGPPQCTHPQREPWAIENMETSDMMHLEKEDEEWTVMRHGLLTGRWLDYVTHQTRRSCGMKIWGRQKRVR